MSITTPKSAIGLSLCKIQNGDLVMCEIVFFALGSPAVDTALRRASISGEVGPVGETGDYWADFINMDGDWFETVKLDRKSWNSLKNRWMKCGVAS